MNKTKIEWTDYSWNPITGCLHNCWYCYAKKLFTRFHKSFEPTFYPERLSEPFELKKSSKIFVCSVSDLFAPWTPIEWRNEVLRTIEKCNGHIFQLLTKNPELIPPNYFFPDYVWVGATATNNYEAHKAIKELRKVNVKTKFLSLEPLLGCVDYLGVNEIDWVIVGKLTGSKRVRLEHEWVDSIIEIAETFNIPIFIKNNINRAIKIQQFPKEAK